MWFEVSLPFFLRDAVHGFGWELVAVGAVLAVRPWPVLIPGFSWFVKRGLEFGI
jgi:hypothetical protein